MIRPLRSLPFTPALFGLACLIAGIGSAHATGFPPFAADDSATVKRGATVSVLDNGATSVLANDFDLEGDPLTAVLVRPPRRGELEFFEDGTFIYRHNGRNRRDDRFEYQAYDGSSFSRRVEVTINVIPGDPIPPQITGQRDVVVDEDASVEIRLEDLIVTDPDSDYPRDFTLEVRDGENYSRSGAVISPRLNYNGQLSVPVRVSDGSAFSNVFDLVVTVRPRNDPPTTTGSVPDQEALEGERFSLSLADRFEDIDAGDRLRFSASGLPRSGSLSIDRDTGVLSGVPVRADAVEDAYRVTVTATDMAGASASLSFSLRIFPDNRSDLAVTASVIENPTLLGEPSLWSIVVENRGPAALEEGRLTSTWITSGPLLDLGAPAGCTLQSDNSVQPSIECPLAPLAVGETVTLEIEGVQEGDGDNTVFVNTIADDPNDENNAARVSAQVAAALSEGPAERIDASATALAAADFDGDGFIDLAVLGDDLSVYWNTGQRSFSPTAARVGPAGTHVVALDWNGDGLSELASLDAASGDVSIYAADGAGSFAELSTISIRPAGSVAAVVANDFDQDGFDDIVTTGGSGTRSVRVGSDGAASIDQLSTLAGLDLAVTDLNGDGAPDLALVAASDRSLNLLENDGTGGFAAAGSFDAGPAKRLASSDLDADGVMDLMLAIDDSAMAAPYTQIMKGVGDGTYVFSDSLGASPASALLSGDVDADGYVDVVVVNAAGVHQIYRGNATGGFTLDEEQIVSDGMRAGLLLDAYNDDSLDLIIAGPDVDDIEVHANNGTGRLGLGDVVPPEIALEGEAVISIPAGGTFVDPGATATDNIDGDLSGAIVVSGSVDASVVGTYTLTYSVSDRASNQSEVTRTVKVGVNTGTGGGGGGALSLVAMLGLALLITLRLHAGVIRRR